MQQAVDHFGAGHFDVIGEVKAPLKGARGDPAVEKFASRAIVIGRLAVAAGDHQAVVLGGHGHILAVETGDRHGDAVIVLVDTFDVVGRVAGLRAGLGGVQMMIEHSRHPVETNRGAEDRGEINGSHDATSFP